MSGKMKNFFSKFRMNRAAVVTAVTLIVALAMIVAITAAANRARRAEIPNDAEVGKTGDVTTIPGSVEPGQTTSGKTTSHTSGKVTTTTKDKPASSVSQPVAAELPTLILPVTGALLKGHDLTLQVFSNTMNDYRVHEGIDIAASLGSPVYAAADGKIDQIWEDVKFGMCISVLHDGNGKTVYKNLAPDIPDGIAVGVKVERGQLIGAVGESAMVEVADEPHLHFEVFVDGKSVDPTEYFDSTSVAALDKDIAYEE